jgi:hypothetical protein
MSRETPAIVRLVPEEPFPPYTFVPGQSPHPVSDPAGHSFGRTPPLPPRPDPESWQACKPYLYGIDLFNAGYYWESHVEFESLWLACGRRGDVADFIKGLIKLAAAGVKHREGKPAGVKSHSRRAAELFRRVGTERGVFLGLSLEELIRLAEAVRGAGWPEPPPLLLPDLPPHV